MLTKINVVGDLSLQNPASLDKVMGEAIKDCDILVQMGDICPGYDVVNKYKQLCKEQGKLFFAVQGNHDSDSDWAKIDVNSSWVCYDDKTGAAYVGLNNGRGVFTGDDWKNLDAVKHRFPVIIFTHKPISEIVLENGSLSGHIMGEDGNKCEQDAAQSLETFMREELDGDALMVTGHYHNWTYQKCIYGDVLVEGRGGAGPNLGYTQIVITADPKSVVFRKFDL